MKSKFLAMLLAVLLLTGCGGKPVETVVPTVAVLPTETETVPATEAATEPTTVETVFFDVPLETQPEPGDGDFVLIEAYSPTARVELAYGGTDNFTGEAIYNFQDAYLRYATVKKLTKAANALAELGYGILIWDAYRPVYAQERLWEICPDPAYVSKPGTGSQSHCRGVAVDLTLYELDTGALCEMPTGFDNFTALADRDYSDCTPEAAQNAKLLESIMADCGFKPYRAEWWHYSDTQSFDIEETFDPAGIS